jgi:putative ABC transport system substrate-binding protein
MVCIFIAMFSPRFGEAQQISVAVIYPDVAPPYNAVLSQIISGINQQVGINVKEYPLNDEYDSVALRKKLEERNTEVIIALGRRGTEAVQALKWEKPVIVGAASLTSSLLNIYGDSLSAIRLTPDPDLLFAKLREFSRKSKRIIVVTNTPQGRAEPKGSEPKAAAMEETWLLDAARESAKKYDFELLVYPATDLRMVANLYRKIIEGMQPETDALWLPPDDESIDIRSILPVILQGAWDRRIIVFCSNPAYAKRGALFALYPDNAKTGQRLAVLAIDAVKNGRARILPTQEVLTAVNMRTAEHLRLRELAQKQQYFDAVYPSP